MPEEEAILDRMQSLIDHWQETGDERVVFLQCYRLMTANVLSAVNEQAFRNPQWVSRLLHRFADYYFAALAAYEQQPQHTPAVWRVAFDAARSAQQKPLQNLILGVNAHINYDLVLTLVDMLQEDWHRLDAAERAGRYRDHCHVNDVIGLTIDTVQDQVIEPSSPPMAILDAALGPLDEWLTSSLISHWREEVWQNALRYLAATRSAEQETLRRQIEAITLKRAKAIQLSGGLLDLRLLI